jgi:hypothetical protein
MDNSEALKKIEEIHSVIAGSNRAILSGERMMVTGALVTLIPLIEWLTHSLTFGYAPLLNSAAAITAIHIAFYWGLFSLAGRTMPFKKLDRSKLHPLIQKAFSVSKPFTVALIGMIVAFVAIGQDQLIYPMVFILLGFLFSLYGRFSIPAVTYIAWSYILLGIAYAYLTKFHIENLAVLFGLYNGLSLVAMGLFLRRTRMVA